MIIAVVSAVIVELIFAGRVGDLVGRRPMLEMEDLSFLMRIGMTLVAARISLHFGKRPVCFAKAHWLVVEILNMRVRAKSMKRASVSPEG